MTTAATPPTGAASPTVLRRAAFGVGITTLSQLAVGIGSAVQAILIAVIFGSNAVTDGFFAAYGVYSLAVLLGQSWRTTLPARMLESDSRFGAFNRFLGAAVLIFFAFGLVFVGLGAPVAALMTGDLPGGARDTAREALLIFWPAIAGQFIAALSAAMLGVLGNYTRAAIAYAAGSVVSVLAFLGLEPLMGITAVPVGMAIGTLVNVAPLVAPLVRAGWRPTRALLLELGPNARAAWLSLTASLTNVFVYLVFVVSLGAAARLGEGVTTIYSYAYFALGLVTTLVGSSVLIVLAAPLAARWDRQAATLRPYLDDVFRVGLMIVIPIAAAGALVGDDVCTLLLSRFSHSQVKDLITTFLILSPSMITTVAATIPSLALFTLGRYRATAAVALLALVMQAALSTGAAAIGSLAALAAAGTVASLTRLAGTLVLVYGRDVRAVSLRLGGQLLQVGLPALACFALPALLLHGTGGALGDATAFAVGLLGYAGFVWAFMPAHKQLAVRLLGSLRPART